MRQPLKILLTIDTEAWPFSAKWREERMAEDIQRDIYGATPEGEFGLDFQCQMLESHGLTAVFFVESLFSTVVGTEALRGIVGAIGKYRRQTIELHAHPEWARYFRLEHPIAGMNYNHFHQLDLATQVGLVQMASANLRAAGVEKIRGFRAGSYGANVDTCRAVAAAGIPFDFSYMPGLPYCKIDSQGEVLTQPTPLAGVIEVPTSCFQDYPGHIRHTQICACSFAEMRRALIQAWEKGWSCFVILSHTFELTRDRKRTDRPPRVNSIAVRRMEELSRFLERENDRFVTIGCDSLATASVSEAPKKQRLRGTLLNTIVRFSEQARVRWM